MSELAVLSTEHYFHDLGLHVWSDDRTGGGWMKVGDEMRAAHGGMHAGLHVVAMDAVAGRVAVRATLPEMIATSHISVQTNAPVRAEALYGESTLLRRGRSSVAVSVTLYEHALAPGGAELAAGGRGPELGRGIATFNMIGGSFAPEAAEALDNHERSAENIGKGFPAPFFESIGLREVDAGAGVFEVSLSPYITNHVGALQGGIFGALIEAAAEGAAAGVVGAPVVVLDFAVPYLAMGKHGPFRSEARVVRATREHALVEIDLIDSGQGDRLMTRSTALAVLRP